MLAAACLPTEARSLYVPCRSLAHQGGPGQPGAVRVSRTVDGSSPCLLSRLLQNCDHPIPSPHHSPLSNPFPAQPGDRLEHGRFWALSMPHILFRGNSRPWEPALEGLAVGCTAQAEPGFLTREVGVPPQAASFRGERERDSDFFGDRSWSR